MSSKPGVQPNAQPAADKVKRERSPSFPFIPLEKAIERAKALADNHKRSPARLVTIAPTWGYAPKSSGLLQTASTLKQFGLIEDTGSGDERKVQLTDLAWRILMDTRPGVKEQSIKEAALKSPMIAEYAPLWAKSRPNDNHCISELHLDRGFTADSAKAFLRVFDETISFANLKDDDNISSSLENEVSQSELEPKSSKTSPKIELGDLIQWESQGVLQFQQPARVREIRNDPQHGLFLFVEGHAGGVPLEQAQLVQKGTGNMSSAQVAQAPSSFSTISALINRATFPLPEGIVALEFPENISKESLEELKAWFELMMKRAQRKRV